MPTASRTGETAGRSNPLRGLLALSGLLGVLSLPVLWHGFRPYQINITQYKLQFHPSPTVASVLVFSVIAFLLPLAPAVIAARRSGIRFIPKFFELCAPLLLALPAAIYCAGSFAGSTRDTPDTPATTFFGGFQLILLAMIGAGWTALRAGAGYECSRSELSPAEMAGAKAQNPNAGMFVVAVIAIIAAITALTYVHVQIQRNFYNHFMFGHADIGHFAEELKNALAGRGLRSDSFENTRLGWHFVPLMYVLVPGYALWPSITYLMTLGPLVLHATALPVFWLARRRSNSLAIAFVCAAAWLLLPSLSRLVYSNTYGFAWLYTSVPVLGFLLGAALVGRWKLCWALVIVLLLSRETHTAITLGFGTYLALFTARRRAGIFIIVISLAYAILCAAVIIPYFAQAGRYERLDIFGELGNSIGDLAMSMFTKPGVFFERLGRAPSLNFVLVLLATLCFLPVRGWKLAMAAAPSLLVHLLMQNPDWISIKFWHHAMVLPILFFAALTILGPGPIEVAAHWRQKGLGVSLALLTCAAWGHYFFGFSPLAKSYEPYANDAFLQSQDPRLEFVGRLRDQIPHDKTILATERLATHFVDFKRLYTGGRIRPVDYVILDRSDQWDQSGLRGRANEFGSSLEYREFAAEGPIIVFERRKDAPPVVVEP